MALLRMHKDVYPPHKARDIETPDEPSPRLRELVEREPAHTWAELEDLNLIPEEFACSPDPLERVGRGGAGRCRLRLWRLVAHRADDLCPLPPLF